MIPEPGQIWWVKNEPSTMAEVFSVSDIVVTYRLRLGPYTGLNGCLRKGWPGDRVLMCMDADLI